MPESRVLIIGGGAAGLSAAIVAARLGAGVMLLEAGARVGRKILESGNGRCNLSNLSASPSAYNHPDFVEPVLGAYPCEAICSFFGEIGLLTHADDEGRVYPVTNAASSVLDALRLECAHLGVETRCGFEVERISEEPGSGGFEVLSQDGETVRAEAVVVTTGGGGSLLAGLGHGMIERVPVLGPIKTEAEPIRGLSGVRVRCAATLLVGVDDDNTGGNAVATERGELLFRDYGVSGIMVFDLSRYLGDGCAISIDFFPDVSLPELRTMIEQRSADLPWRTVETYFAGMLHDRVARAIMRAAGIGRDTPVEKLPVARLAALLKDFRLGVLGMGDARQAQVTRGGASVEGFDPNAMASRVVDGLFAAGEVLDIDGRSGGLNLHWAWASGIVAGEAAARSAMARAADRDVSSKASE
ncbi:MAG: aminoacetone oxidase family FAD-binding enzyme [Actinomycetota bacterium]|nr:aminoacetone oxidase family FAD-binding enzyme [Actinomycetota bacterium]